MVTSFGSICWLLALLTFFTAITAMDTNSGLATGCLGGIIGVILLVASIVLFVVGCFLFLAMLSGNA